MPSLSTEYFSVDTIQVMDARAAFINGELGIVEKDIVQLGQQLPAWNSSIINMIIVSVTIFLCILTIKQIVEILPYIIGGISRSKPVMNLENNVRLTRERNLVSMVSIIIISIFLSKFRMIHFDFLDRYDPGIGTLAIYGAVLLVLLIRLLLSRILEPRRRGKDYYRASSLVFLNFLILLAALFLITLGICSVTNVNELTIKHILEYETIGITLLFCLRKLDLSSHFCNLFNGFLYLCALEFFPAALLIGASLLF